MPLEKIKKTGFQKYSLLCLLQTETVNLLSCGLVVKAPVT